MATKKSRSPRYPQLSLEEAVEQVGKVYRTERTHKVDKEAVAVALGYSTLNGASIGRISALKSYGLLEEDKEGVSVAGDAITILRAPEGDPERAEALLRAAFAPQVFAELRETYGDDLSELPSENTLRYRLEKRGFLEKAAGEVIRRYRDNLEFVSQEAAEYTAADELVDQPPLEVEVQPQQPVNTPSVVTPTSLGVPSPVAAVEQQGTMKEFLHVFAKDCEMRLLIDGAVTQEAIDRLIGYLELGKEDLPSRRELEQPAIEQPAEQPAIEMPASENRA